MSSSSRPALRRAFLGLLLALSVVPALAQPQAPVPSAPEAGGKEPDPALDPRLKEVTQVTQGTLTVRGKTLAYRAVAGLLPVDDDKDEPSAVMSYVAYFGKTAPGAPARPVLFLYNGGPGSSSVWLHMGAFGPKRVLTGNGQRGPAAPYRLVDNEDTLLDVADLVFIDAPGTGFGRIVAVAKDKAQERALLVEKEKGYWGVDQDAQAFARFIKKFLTRNNLWNAPRYLFGESYGTTRSAVLVNLLQDRYDIDMNGVLLLSQILNFSFSPDEPNYAPGDDLAYALALPTYAATAWYHQRLPAWADRSPQTLDRLVAAAQQFALGEYLSALTAGARLDPAQRHAVAEKLGSFIGLPVPYLEKAQLRVDGGTFSNQLLADQGLSTGRLDTRYSGPSLDPLAKSAEYDPQSAAISSAYVSVYNDYVRNVLKFGADLDYRPSAPVWRLWDWKHQPPGAYAPRQQTLNVMTDLAAAMRVNPRLKVANFAGLYDLATPFAAAEFELEHLPIPSALRANIEVHRYPAGHMMYDDPASLARLHDAVARFLRETATPVQ
ncbi:MAG: peptidase S10 [Burkholderiales bacterium]|nr:peptidase S10 [Burkholderiales bacterium]